MRREANPSSPMQLSEKDTAAGGDRSVEGGVMLADLERLGEL